MSALLAVETSGSWCSLAIRADGRWHEDTHKLERLHNRAVLVMLEELTRRAEVSRDAFSAVAFGAGPGSFTGVRIAASVAQGVAFACGAVTVPVPSSQALALCASRDPRCGAGVATVIRSRRDAYYVTAYRLGNEEPEPEAVERLHQGASVPEEIAAGALPGAGDRPRWWPAGRSFIDDVTVTARDIGDLAMARLARGEGGPPEAALPVYVSGDSPWVPAQP